MTSKIQQELAKAAECDPKKGETISSPEYIKRLVVLVSKLSDPAWEKLSAEAQDWTNAAAAAVNKGKDAAPYPDLKEEAEEPVRRRRAAVDDDEDKKTTKAYEPAKGDVVKVVTKRGKEYEGKVVDPDDKGELVLLVGKDEIGVDLERIDTITPVQDEKDEPKSRRRQAEDDEPDLSKAEPEVKDTVEITTSRGKVLVGNVIEIDDKIIVIKTAAGVEVEFDLERVKSVVVKVKNAGAKKDAKKDEEPTGRTRTKSGGEEPEADAKTKRTSKDDNGGVSVTMRARELICDNMDATKEQITKMMQKEGLEFKENTVQLIYTDCHKMFKLLRDRKLLKG